MTNDTWPENKEVVFENAFRWTIAYKIRHCKGVSPTLTEKDLDDVDATILSFGQKFKETLAPYMGSGTEQFEWSICSRIFFVSWKFEVH